MIDFNEPTLEDKKRADELFHQSDYRANDYCFGNMFIWRKKYKVQTAFYNGFILIRFLSPAGISYLYPVGGGDKAEVIREMRQDAKSLGVPFTISSVIPSMQEELDRLFPEKFSYSHDRNLDDYLYLSQSLITLSGKKYHGKRNHVTRFKAGADWSFEEIGPENIEDCVKMNEIWCRQNGCNTEPALREEFCAVSQAFRNYEKLGFSGGLLRKGGEVVAFSIGEQLCLDTFVVHIEKAFSSVEGAYPAINQEFSSRFCPTFQYVNREEDTGDEGLRKAKLSYHPAILLEKYTAALKPGETL